MNPLLKNCRTGYHEDLLHRTSHYNKLLKTKPSVSNKQTRNYLSLLNNPYKKQLKKQQTTSNLKLIRSLVDIERKESRYGLTDQDATDSLKKKFVKNKEYEQRNREKTLSNENFRLFTKILSVESDFSTQKLRQFNSKITKYSKLIHHPLKNACKIDQQLYTTYRHHLHSIKTNKDKNPSNSKGFTFNTSLFLKQSNNKKKKAFKLKTKKRRYNLNNAQENIERELVLEE